MQFGESVQLDYVDLAHPEAQAEFEELLALIEEQSLPYPLVAINDQLRLAGSVEYHRILPLVQQVLESEAAVPEA
jgi:disulfide oxidoreductase YuzD